MKQSHPKLFKHKTWAPSDLEKLSGLSPVSLRDLRRRELIPKDETRTLKLETVAQLLLLSELTAHGFGPKSIQKITVQFANKLRDHALQHRCAWTDDRSHTSWLNSSFGKQPKENYLFIERAGGKVIAVRDIDAVHTSSAATVTLVDIRWLGAKLGKHLALRPSALVDSKGRAGQ